MYILDKFEIEGIWSSKTVSSKLDNCVNIFIGKNGTGKTTVINILHAVMIVDLSQLANLDFKSVKLTLLNGNSRLNITVTKTERDIYFGDVKYKIGRNAYDLPLITKEAEMRRRLHSKVIETIDAVRNKMKSLISVSWLSVHRDIIDDDDNRDRYISAKNLRLSNPIDKRLIELMSKLTSYQLQLQSQFSKLSSDFQIGRAHV